MRYIKVKVDNTNELKELLQKATDQLEQLEIIMKQIETFELKMTVN
ncbi:hypothetical protein [Rossellomorea marisflavi]